MPPPDNRVPFLPQGERSTRFGWVRHGAANQVYLGIFGFFLDSSGSLQKVFRVWVFFLGFFWFFAQGDE
jgi:hypothetical protein